MTNYFSDLKKEKLDPNYFILSAIYPDLDLLFSAIIQKSILDLCRKTLTST
jgi:hypothetical protein